MTIILIEENRKTFVEYLSAVSFILVELGSQTSLFGLMHDYKNKANVIIVVYLFVIDRAIDMEANLGVI